MKNKQSITTFQLFFLLIHIQVGVGVISLPYDIYSNAGRDSWISVILTGMIIQLLIFLYSKLMNRFPSHNLYDIISLLFGKFVGKAIAILYFLLYAFFGSLLLANFVYLLKAWMMPHTPKWILLVLMCFTAVFIVKENLQIIARFVVISSVVFIGFFAAATYALKYSTFTYLLPIAHEGILPIIKGLPQSLFAFQGFEVLLIIFPFVQASNKKIIKIASGANLFVTFFYLLLVTVSMVFFSSEELKLVPEPVLYLIKGMSFRVLERPDLLFTSMWIVLVATTLIATVYIASLGLSTIKNTKGLTKYAIIVAIITFFGALFLNNRHTISTIAAFQGDVLIPIIWGFPIVLLLVSILMKKKEEVDK